MSRFRCNACGNLTRFDVTTSRRTRSFHHYSVGGELTIEDEEVLAEAVEAVSCRWCGNGDSVIEVSDRADAEGVDTGEADVGRDRAGGASFEGDPAR